MADTSNLKIEITQNNGKTIVDLHGRLDTITAPELEKKKEEILFGTQLLIIDLNHLDYISSAGLRILLIFQKEMRRQGEMIIQNANETVLEIFEVTGFSDILSIE